MDIEERLTAYALNDAGLTTEERAEIERHLAEDDAARAGVEATREMAGLLAQGLAAEQAALPVEPPVITPLAKPKAGRAWAKYAVAATLLLAVGAMGYVGWKQVDREREQAFAKSVDGLQQAMRASEMGRDDGLGRGATGAHIRDAVAFGDEALQELPAGKSRWAEADQGLRHPLRPGVEVPAIRSRSPRVSEKPPSTTTLPAPDGPSGAAGPGLSQNSPHYLELPKSESGIQLGTVPDGYAANSRDSYPALKENDFIAVEGQAALSTFGVDVDTASYSIVRKYLGMNAMPPGNAVRLEELVNYFPYRDKAPDGNDPFAVTVELAECPWQPKHQLARVGLKAKPLDLSKRPASNLVFLIDGSGSMNEPNRLPLVKASLKLLVNQLGENDRVAMVVYAGNSGLVLDSTSAVNKERIFSALNQLEAGGSTNGGSGIVQAYNVAVANFIPKGTNRVILCTDGDWNVGTTSTPELIALIEEKRKTNVFLSVLGFGMGNLRDEMMVQLAGKGNGNYAYIDTLREANKALVEQLGGTLFTVAKDVKIQVEFNPAAVKSYRLLGYEKRALAAKDFHDDTKDAGEMGAGHVVTALYELVPAGEGGAAAKPEDGLKYQPKPDVAAVKREKPGEAFTVKMRHKQPDGDVSTLRELPVPNRVEGYGKASEDFRFAAAVASFGMLLRDSPHKGNATYAAVLELADAARTFDPNAYRAEFVEMVRKAKALSGKP